MRHRFLLGSTALLFLLVLWQILSFHLKAPERTIAYESRKEGSVAVELVIENQDQGIFYFQRDKSIGEFLSATSAGPGEDNKTPLRDGMSIRIDQHDVTHIDEMAAAKKLALGILVDINQLSTEEITLIPGIGEKTASAIYLYIKSKGCIRDLSELADIRGIKERKIASMRRYLTTKPEACGRLPRT